MNPPGEACCSPIFTIFSPDPACRTAEHAMGQFAHAMAIANTRTSLSLQGAVQTDRYHGFSVPERSGQPVLRRGRGLRGGTLYRRARSGKRRRKTRLYHFFNSAPIDREEPPRSPWGLDRRPAPAAGGWGRRTDSALPAAGQELQTYWDHKYFRMLISVTFRLRLYHSFPFGKGNGGLSGVSAAGNSHP